MENRVGLNLLYAQVSLEVTLNPSPENDSGVPLCQENSFHVFSPSSWGSSRILSGYLAQLLQSLLCKLITVKYSLQRVWG